MPVLGTLDVCLVGIILGVCSVPAGKSLTAAFIVLARKLTDCIYIHSFFHPCFHGDIAACE